LASAREASTESRPPCTVAKAHGVGIIHRDLKPDRVLLVPYEDGEMAKVLDFGIAKRKVTRRCTWL
jgi:serine/threonine protein kinase